MATDTSIDWIAPTKSKTWRCTKNGCKARCKTDLEHSNVQFTNEHCDHETQSDRYMTIKEFRRNCNRRGADDLFQKPLKIMRKELQNINAHLETGDIERVRKAVYHERRKQLPTLPNSRAETHDRIDQHQVTSCRGEPMIHVNDAAKGIIILTTRTNMQLLCDRNAQIFGDGAFKTCPRFFYQLYTLRAYKNGRYVACVFVLLPSKAQDAYVDMFEHIKTKAENFGIVFQPQDVTLDFEKATHAAAKSI